MPGPGCAGSSLAKDKIFNRKVRKEMTQSAQRRAGKNGRVKIFLLFLTFLALLSACTVERRKSNAELGLNEQQAAGRALYDQYCDRCHEPYSSRGKKGPSMKGLYKK